MSSTESWGRFADSYLRQLPLERSAIELLLDLICVERQERVLDVGTGPAVLLAALARRPESPHQATGVDSSPEMLALAPRLPSGWELRDGDATRLPFEDGCFDVVCASYLLHVLDPAERRDAVAEMARVLRPGGRIATTTITPPRRAATAILSAPVRALADRSSGRMAGLRALDPASDLKSASFRETRRAVSLRGYPSLCLVAELLAGPSRAPRRGPDTFSGRD